MSESSTHEQELASEQAYVDVLYARLDEARERAEAALAQVRRGPTAGNPGALAERDAFTDLHTERARAPCAASRNGSASAGSTSLAPGAEARRAAASLRRPHRAPRRRRRAAARRLARARGRVVLPGDGRPARRTSCAAGTSRPAAAPSPRVEDDVLDLDAFERSGEAAEALVGRRRADARARRAPHGPHARHRRDDPDRAGPDHPLAARRRARRRGRPGHRQDRRRAAPRRVPALRPPRADREVRRAARRSRPVFLRYVEQVLPVARRDGRAAAHRRPAVPRRRRDRAWSPARPPRSRATPGWPTLVLAAVQARQRVPAQAARARRRRHRSSCCKPGDVAGARDRARAQPQAAQRGARRLRQGRARSARHAARGPARRRARLGQPLGAARDAARVAPTCAARSTSAGCRSRPSGCWPTCSPTRPRSRGSTPRSGRPDAVHRARAARCWCASAASAWTPADVPLLDEVAELVGDDDTADQVAAARAAQERKLEVDYAQQVLQMSGTGDVLTADDPRRPLLLDRRTPDRRRARRRRPHLDLRPRRRRRGAGAVADDVAAC